jgi:hypothetical protein
MSVQLILPYDIINKILDYVSQMNDSLYTLNLDYKGKFQTKINKTCEGVKKIQNINLFKQIHPARQLLIRIQFDDSLEIKEYHGIEEHLYYNNLCYKFYDTETQTMNYAYVNLYEHENGVLFSFTCGDYYCGHEPSWRQFPYQIIGYARSTHGVIMLINPMNMIWDVTPAQIPEYELFLNYN